MTAKDVTPAVKSAVNAYLMARTRAEVMHEKVEEFYKEALEIFPLYTDRFAKRGMKRERIYKSKDMYLSKDEETCQDIYKDVNFHLRKKGLKPDDMPDDFCPALVAENLQTTTEHLMVKTAAEMIGQEITVNGLLCLGLDEYHKFINLVVGLVVNLPDFKNPLTT